MMKSLPEIKFSDDEIFYSTDTLYDIKKKIQKKYGIDPIFIDIVERRGYSRNPDWKALVQLFPKIEKKKISDEVFELELRRSHLFDNCPKYPFKNQNVISPKYEQVIREIFYYKRNILQICKGW